MSGTELERAAKAFRARFGREPSHAAAAPGRLNLIGEHTDYNEGFVLPLAIDRWVAAAVAPAPGACSRLHAADLDETVEADLTGPVQPVGGFADYLIGVAAELAGPHPRRNLDVVVLGSLPPGAGLASSAALEVAFARAVLATLGVQMEPRELARVCQRAEHACPGTPCGPMDQLVATHAVPGQVTLIDCRSLELLPLPLGDTEILVVDSGVRRTLADGGFAAVRERCAEAAAALHVPSLRDADRSLLGGLAPSLRGAAQHVIEENERTLLAAAALRASDAEALGELLLDGHASLRDNLGVSCAELDAIVDRAASLRSEGVLGARLTGAGFGGCALVACRPGTGDALAGRFSDFPTTFRAA